MRPVHKIHTVLRQIMSSLWFERDSRGGLGQLHSQSDPFQISRPNHQALLSQSTAFGDEASIAPEPANRGAICRWVQVSDNRTIGTNTLN